MTDQKAIEWTAPGALSFRLHIETWDGLGPHQQRLATPADLAAAGYIPAAECSRLRTELGELRGALEFLHDKSGLEVGQQQPLPRGVNALRDTVKRLTSSWRGDETP